MKPRLSIDIGSRNLHMVYGQYSKDKLVVSKTGSYLIPPEAPRTGKEASTEAIEEVISDAMREMGIQTRDCILTINSETAAIKDIELPISRPKEIERMIEYEMIQNYQTAEDDIIQYKFTGQVVNDNGDPMNRYRVATLDEATVESYYEMLHKLKFRKVFLDLNINAMDKLMDGVSQINGYDIGDEAVLLLDYGHTKTTAYVKRKDEPVLFRTLQIGSGEIEQILELEAMKSREEIRSLKESDRSFFKEDSGLAMLFDFLKPYFYHFQDEVSKIVSFYSTQQKNGSISRIFLTGNGAQMTDLPIYFTNNLGFPVETVTSLKYGKEEISVSPAHVNAIAALIRN